MKPTNDELLLLLEEATTEIKKLKETIEEIEDELVFEQEEIELAIKKAFFAASQMRPNDVIKAWHTYYAFEVKNEFD